MREYNRGSRLELLQFIKQKKKSKSYLEIGCHKNEVFNYINAINKVGVDPNKGGTHRMTSDEFFDTNTDTFDLIFIDGLHHYEQLKTDLENAFKILNPGGVIVLHDMLPFRKDRTSREHNTRIWNGDVWRLNFNIINNQSYKYHIVNIDQGCGVISKVKEKEIYFEEIITDDYNYYLENKNLLPVIPSIVELEKNI